MEAKLETEDQQKEALNQLLELWVLRWKSRSETQLLSFTCLHKRDSSGFHPLQEWSCMYTIPPQNCFVAKTPWGDTQNNVCLWMKTFPSDSYQDLESIVSRGPRSTLLAQPRQNKSTTSIHLPYLCSFKSPILWETSSTNISGTFQSKNVVKNVLNTTFLKKFWQV